MLRSVWNDATVTQHVSCDERGKAEQREVKDERQTRHCSFTAQLPEKGLPWKHFHFSDR